MGWNMFKMQERMLAVVPRWSGLPRLHQQSVAEHSFYVALYTDIICRSVGMDTDRTYAAVSYALIHDMAESTTGDIMGPIKRSLVSYQALEAYERKILAQMGPHYVRDELEPGLRKLVKCANIIDEYFHISLELAMGNMCMTAMQTAIAIRLQKALTDIGLLRIYNDIINEGGKMLDGIQFLQENSDLG